MASQDYPEYREKLKIFDNVLDLNFLQDPLSQTIFSDVNSQTIPSQKWVSDVVVNKKEPAIWLKEIAIKRWLSWWFF